VTQAEFYRLFAFFDRSEASTTQVPPTSVAGDTAQMDASVLTKRSGSVQTYLLIRGNFSSPDTALGPLSPGTPSARHLFTPRAALGDRLDLANWLVDPQNPLTARVIVNTIWSHLFGRGIVRERR
jgi:hypothetical protein